MNDNLTAALIAAALLLTGTAAGIGLSSVADGATTVTVTPPPVTVTAPPKTVTITRTVEATRASRSQLRGLTPWQRDYWQRAQSWAATAKARAVIACESSNRPSAISTTGKYRGLWQMDADFWASYGGLEIARRADLASRAAQNYVAYRGFVSRGWTPWDCA